MNKPVELQVTPERLAVSAKAVLESLAFKTAMDNLDAAIIAAWRSTESTNHVGLQKCRDLMDIANIFKANLMRFVADVDSGAREEEESLSIIW